MESNYEQYNSIPNPLTPKCKECNKFLKKTNKLVSTDKYGNNVDVPLYICASCNKLYPEYELIDLRYMAYLQSEEEGIYNYAHRILDDEEDESLNGNIDENIMEGLLDESYDFMMYNYNVELEFAINAILNDGSYTINQLTLDKIDGHSFFDDLDLELKAIDASYELKIDELSDNIFVLSLENELEDDEFEVSAAKKPPIIYYGGKSNMSKDILKLIPNHETYVEAFGGAGNVLFAKDRSKYEVYNDLNGNLVNFYKVVQDKSNLKQLMNDLKLTAYNKRDFDYSKKTVDSKTGDMIENARKFFLSKNMAINGNGGFSIAKDDSMRGMSKSVAKFLAKVERLPSANIRLRNVTIENKHFRDFIKKYDSEDTFFYLDPPYHPDTRKQKKSYKHEMTVEEHIELVNILKELKGKVMLSGYDNKDYKPLEECGFEKRLLGVYDKGSSHNKKKSSKKSADKAEEYIWINYCPEKEN